MDASIASQEVGKFAVVSAIPDPAAPRRIMFKHRDGTDEWDNRSADALREEIQRLAARIDYLEATP